jgi:DNA-binding SARP family transcriptional activator
MNDEPDILLRLLGPFGVVRRGCPLPLAEVGNRQARRLLALLAIQPGRLVAVNRIVEVLWADGVPRHPVANVATLVSRLRAALGGGIVRGDRRGGYRLGAGVRVDLHHAADLVVRAEALLGAGETARALVTGRLGLAALEESPVLTDERDSEWVQPARRLQDHMLRRARHVVANAALAAGDPGGAVLAAEAAVAADPFDEAAHRILISAHHARGDTVSALLAYERLRATLAEELGIDPARATRDLHRAILRGVG